MRPSRISFAIAALAWSAGAGSAQTLDQAVRRQLDNNCVVLGTFDGNNSVPPGDPPIVGPNLHEICRDNNAAPDAISNGGGGALSQTSDTQLGRQRAESRLEELREGEEGAAKDVLQVVDLFRIAGLGLWASGDYAQRDREVTTFEDGFESEVAGANAGVDYRFADFLVAGLAYNFQDIDAELTNGGDFETESHGVVAYGSLSPVPELFVDASIGYAWRDYSMDRPVSFTEIQENSLPDIIVTLQHVGVASSDTDGQEFSARAIVGYDHALGGVTIGPRAGVNFVHTEIDGYSETGTSVGPQIGISGNATGIELVYHDRTRQSLQSVLGAAVSAASSLGFGVLIPTFDVEWVHEFQDDQRHYSARFVEDLRPNPVRFGFQNERPDRDFFNLNAGVSVVLAHGVQLFAQYRTILGHDYFESRGVAAGVRVELGGAAP